MAYRRRQGIQRNSTFKEEIYHPHAESTFSSSNSVSSPSFVSSPSSLTHRDLSFSSGYGNSSLSFDSRDSEAHRSQVNGNVVEDKAAYLIKETRKLHVSSRKGGGGDDDSEETARSSSVEAQLKASRDLAMGTAAKAKLLLRELKTVKADMAFSKERCRQLEEENKLLREGRDKGGTPDDDDLIRVQLETLLAEKARLAHENSVYARENRFLREVVECHHTTMDDFICQDEDDLEEAAPEEEEQARMLSSEPLGKKTNL